MTDQSRTDPSSALVAIVEPSGEYATDSTAPLLVAANGLLTGASVRASSSCAVPLP